MNNKGARVIFEEIAQNGGEPMAIVEAKGLKQIGSVEELEAVVKKVIEDNQKIVEQYKGWQSKCLWILCWSLYESNARKRKSKMFQEILKRLLG